MKRTRWRRPRPKIRRVADTEPLPKEWPVLCKEVRHRDRHQCRHCGREARDGNGQVDHIIPRQLGGGDGLHNLALLCPVCHGKKLLGVEAALYGFEVWPLIRWLESVRQTGPVPPSAAVDHACKRVLELVSRACAPTP